MSKEYDVRMWCASFHPVVWTSVVNSCLRNMLCDCDACRFTWSCGRTDGELQRTLGAVEQKTHWIIVLSLVVVLGVKIVVIVVVVVAIIVVVSWGLRRGLNAPELQQGCVVLVVVVAVIAVVVVVAVPV